MVTIDQVLIEKLNSWYVGEWPIGNLFACLIALVLTVAFVGVIGIEREKRGRSAGLRTHLLVGVGSCIIMIISIYGFPAMFENRDVARLAAQVIAGIGFLGAGAIIYRNSGTKGLTTAATIFIAMAIGLACGSMNFILAAAGTLVITAVLTVFRKLEVKINKVSPYIALKAEANKPIVNKVIDVARQFDCTVNELHTEVLENDTIEMRFFAVSNSNNINTPELLTRLQQIDGVHTVETLNSHKQ